MAPRTPLLPLLAGVVALTRAQIFGCGDSDVLPPKADARQNPADGGPGYVEWWFFTAYSKEHDLGAVLTYHPLQEHSSASAMLYFNASHPDAATTIRVGESFPAGSSSTESANQTLGPANSVTVVDAKTYLLRGSVGETGKGNATWDLRFEQAVDAAREHVDVLGLLKLDWISYMPSAAVSGTVSWTPAAATWRGEAPATVTFELVGAYGYHDHNSGKWPKKAAASLASSAAVAASDEVEASLPFTFDYKWGSTGDAKSVGAVYGAYMLPGALANLSVGYVFVRAHDTHIKFGTLCLGHSIRLHALGFIDRPDGHKEATGVVLTAESPDYQLTWTHQRRSSATGGGGGLGLVVYEQLSVHNLTLVDKRAGATSTAPMVALTNSFGFTEWSNPAS